MKLVKILLAAPLLCVVLYGQSLRADDYLLINLTSYTTPKSHKAIEYANAELKKGRPVIVYLEEASVIVAAKSNAQQFQKQQKSLKELIDSGAIVAVCPHCLKRYAIDSADLLAGVQIAQMERTAN